MMMFLFAMQMMTVQPIIAPIPERLIRIDVVLYQGDPSGKLQIKKKLASEQLMTRYGEKTAVSIGLEKTLIRRGDGTVEEVVNQQLLGTTMIFHPQLLQNGQIFLAGSIKTIEVGNMTDTIQQRIENDVRVAMPCNPNTLVIIPLYNPNDERPFTGKERWVELKVCVDASGIEPLPPASQPLPPASR